jgi:hypothetical protein
MKLIDLVLVLALTVSPAYADWCDPSYCCNLKK